MTQAALTRNLKQAVTDSLKENRDLVRDIFAEVLEDVALAQAIRAGEKSRRVRRESVVKALSRSR